MKPYSFTARLAQLALVAMTVWAGFVFFGMVGELGSGEPVTARGAWSGLTVLVFWAFLGYFANDRDDL